jgi:Arc/MetJ-type ribon-helix-helix transcriptional regulator
MPKPIDPASLPEPVASFAAARVAAGRCASVADVLVAGVEALAAREQAEAEWLDYAREAVRDGDADIAAGRYSDMSAEAFASWLHARSSDPSSR